MDPVGIVGTFDARAASFRTKRINYKRRAIASSTVVRIVDNLITRIYYKTKTKSKRQIVNRFFSSTKIKRKTKQMKL